MIASRYISGIDGLRAIAVLIVVLFHLGFSKFSGGFVGVDIFFCHQRVFDYTNHF